MTETREWIIERDVLHDADSPAEGYALGQLFFEEGGMRVCYTVEDQDRHLEEGNGKIYGTTAMPLGRYELVLYQSPTKGTVPLFIGVPGFSYTEIHKANHANELLGCVGVGMNRLTDGAQLCAPALALVVAEMHKAVAAGQKVFCTIRRAK